MPRYTPMELEELLRRSYHSGWFGDVVSTGAQAPSQTAALWDFEHYFEGANGATSFGGDEVGGRVPTAVGNAQLTTTTPLQGVSSLLLDGTGDYVTIPNQFFWAPWGAFSLEFIIRPTNLNNASTFFSHNSQDLHFRGWSLVVQTTGRLDINISYDGFTFVTNSSATGAIVAGQANVVGIFRNASGVVRVFVNGTQVITFTETRGIFKTGRPLTIGVGWATNSTTSTNYFNGRVDAVRYRKGACFVDASSYVVGDPFYEPSPTYAFAITPSNSAVARAAMEAVLADTDDGLFVFCGDSTTLGLGTNGSDGLITRAFPAVTATYLNTELGMVTNSRGLCGTGRAASTADAEATNPAIAFNSGTLSTIKGLGGPAFRHAATTGATRYTPGGTFNRVRFLYKDPEIGDSIVWTSSTTATASIAGGGTGEWLLTEVDVGSGATWIEWRSGNTNAVDIQMILPFDNAAKQLFIINAGWSGSTTADWNTSEAVTQLNVLQPDVTGVNLGINDIIAAETPATIISNLQTLLDAAEAWGDLLMCSPNGLNTADAGSEATQQPSFTALDNEAAARGCPYMQIKAQMGIWTAANTAGLMNDGAHPNQDGQVLIAQMHTQRLLEVLRAG